MTKSSSSGDVEANVMAEEHLSGKNSPVVHGVEPVMPGDILSVNDRTFFGRINLYLARYQVEARGIERVSEDERTDTSVSNAATVVSTALSSVPKSHKLDS